MKRRVGHVAAAVLLGVIFALAFLGTRVLFRVPENAATIRRICVAVNESNTKQVGLWEFIIGLTANDQPNQGLTPEQQAARVKQVRAFLADTYKPTKC